MEQPFSSFIVLFPYFFFLSQCHVTFFFVFFTAVSFLCLLFFYSNLLFFFFLKPKQCVNSSSVPISGWSLGVFPHPSPYQPIYSSVPICCSALAWHLSLSSAIQSGFSCVCVYLSISPCAHIHMVCAQICIGSSLPCIFYVSTYCSGRISHVLHICGVSFSIPFPDGVVMGIPCKAPHLFLC